MNDYPEIALLIDGEWRSRPARQERRTSPIENPATLAVIGAVPHATKADLDRALAAVERGFAIWRDTPIEARTRILKGAARILRERAGEIGRIMTLEQGKPLAEATGEVTRVAGTLEWDVEEARRAYGRIIPSDPSLSLYVLKRPRSDLGSGVRAVELPVRLADAQDGCRPGGRVFGHPESVGRDPRHGPGPGPVLRGSPVAALPAGVLNLVFGDPATISSI